jgi:hypothetical protein
MVFGLSYKINSKNFNSHYHVYKHLKLERILSYLNPVYIFTNICFNNILSSMT